MRYLIILFLVLLSGCSAKISNPIAFKAGQAPTTGVHNSVTVGSPLFSKWSYRSQKVAFTIQDIQHTDGIGSKFIITPGTPLVYTLKDEFECYCTTFPAVRDFLGAPTSGVCLYSSDGKNFDKYLLPVPNFKPKNLDMPTRYEESELLVGPNGFKYELIYLGMDGSSIKLSYREYSNNIIRPAFTQELSYKIESFPNAISFRGLRFEIIQANNNTLDYKVISVDGNAS